MNVGPERQQCACVIKLADNYPCRWKRMHNMAARMQIRRGWLQKRVLFDGAVEHGHLTLCRGVPSFSPPTTSLLLPSGASTFKAQPARKNTATDLDNMQIGDSLISDAAVCHDKWRPQVVGIQRPNGRPAPIGCLICTPLPTHRLDFARPIVRRE